MEEKCGIGPRYLLPRSHKKSQAGIIKANSVVLAELLRDNGFLLWAQVTKNAAWKYTLQVIPLRSKYNQLLEHPGFYGQSHSLLKQQPKPKSLFQQYCAHLFCATSFFAGI